MITIFLHVPPKRIALFTQLFSYGVTVQIQANLSLRDVLCRQLGIDQTYLDAQIQTIFVDGKAVDLVDDEIIRDGSSIALSAAMPGLVGAIFRKGGNLKSMRSQIRSKKNPLNQKPVAGTITLKLFNQVAADIGPVFLQRGIRIQKDHFKWFFDRYFTTIVSICRGMEIDGRKTKIEEGMSEGWRGSDIKLIVQPV